MIFPCYLDFYSIAWGRLGDWNFFFTFQEAQDEEKSKQETTRKFIAKEMLSTEKSYYESLCVCLNFYQKPLMAKVKRRMDASNDWSEEKISFV